MAEEQTTDKSQLIGELARTRVRLSAAAAELGESLNVVSRAKESFRKHRGIWIGTAALAGLLIAKLPRRKKVVIQSTESAVKAGLAMTVAKIAWKYARPTILAFATKRLGSIAQRHFSSDPGKPPSQF